MVHSVVEPCLKVTVPAVAAVLESDSAKAAWAPKVMVAEVEPLTVVEKGWYAALDRRGPPCWCRWHPQKLPSVSTKVAVTVG